MTESTSLLLGRADGNDVTLLPRFGNRHGLIAGATGTGKSVSLMRLAQEFSLRGVPVVMADVKGDIAGLALPGSETPRLRERLNAIGLADFAFRACPVEFWDLFGEKGQPIRTTISEMGPTLLARVLELSDVQAGVLDIAFNLADAEGLLLIDLDDLRAVLAYIAEKRDEVSQQYGLVSPQSIAAIQRALLRLDQDGGDRFFGEPALDIADLFRTNAQGQGIVHLIAADTLILKPKLYSTFLLWLLSELFETLPEVGDLPQPKLVFIFDEAHLLFDDCPPALRQRVEQVVRLIRSKGVGVYFCSQNPDDVPDEILGQLGNRIQHALRAFTPRDQKAVRTAAETFVQNPALDVAKVISELGVGEALVSTLQANGTPMPVQRTLIAPPGCRIGALSTEERAQVRAQSGLAMKYQQAINRESAFERLNPQKATPSAPPSNAPIPTVTTAPASSAPPPSAAPAPAAPQGPARQAPEEQSKLSEFLWGTNRRQGAVEAAAKSAARTIGNQLGRKLLRGVLGGLLK